MKKSKRLLAVMLALIVALSMVVVGTSSFAVSAAVDDSETIGTTTLTVGEGATIIPDTRYGTVVSMVPKSSNEKVFTTRYSGGNTVNVSAKGVGKATLTVTITTWEYGPYQTKYYDTEVFTETIVVKAASSSSPSSPSSSPVKKIPAPKNIRVQNKGTGIYISCDKAANAKAYRYWWQEGTNKWKSIDVAQNYYTLTNLTPGVLYKFDVYALDFNGEPSLSPNRVSLTHVRGTTLKSTAYNSNGTVTVKWDSAAGANGYAVAKKRSTDKNYTYYYVSGTSFTDKNVVGGAVYYYQIRPYYSNGKSAAYAEWSNSKSITTLYRPTITNINTNNINLLNINWNAIKGATGYKVAFKRSYDSAWNYRTTTSRYFNVSNPTRGATYYVQVCAINGSLAGAYSAVNSHTVAPPLSKTSLTGNTNGSRNYLSWNIVNGAQGYQIAKKAFDQSSFTYFTTTNTYYYDYSITKGKAYAYQVRAYNGGTYGPWSNVTTLNPVVDTPTIYTPTYYSNRIHTTWSSVPGAKYYIVSYKWTSEANWTDINVYTTEFTMSNLKTKDTFNIAVKAVGENGKGSTWSDTKHVYI